MMGFLFVMVVIGRITLLSSLSLRMGSTMGNSIGLKCSGVGIGVGNCNMGEVVDSMVSITGDVRFKQGHWQVGCGREARPGMLLQVVRLCLRGAVLMA